MNIHTLDDHLDWTDDEDEDFRPQGMVDIPGSLATRGRLKDRPENTKLVGQAMSRISQHDPAHLNAVAGAVTDILGFTLLSRRYAIAVLALEALEALDQLGGEQ